MLALLGLTVLRGIIAATTPVLAAEAYYWLWSRQLAAGFHDHPPMVAFFIRAGTLLLGDTALGLRLAAVLGATAAQGVFLVFCRRVVSEPAARVATLLLAVTMVGFPFGVVTTPDAPLLCFWVLALLAAERALSRGTAGRWLLCGALAGLCLLSKYTGGSLLAGIGLLLLSDPTRRAQLRTPWPWLGLAAAALVFAPNLLWIAEHGGSTLAVPFRGLDRPDRGHELARHAGDVASLPISAMALLTPVFFVAWLAASAASWRRLRAGVETSGLRLCLALSWVPLGLFAVLAGVMGVSTHWLAPCFVSALPLIAHWLTDEQRPRPRWLAAGLVNAGLFVLPLALVPPLVMHTGLLAPPSADDPRARLADHLRGPGQLGARVRREVAEHPGPLLLMSSDYHLASLLAWLTDGNPALPLKRNHFNQFEHWYRDGQYAGRDALYVKWIDDGDTNTNTPTLERAFERVTELEPEWLTVAGVPVSSWRLFLCEGFRGPH